MARRIITSLAAGAALIALTPLAAAQDLSPELQAFDEQLPGSLINDPTDLLWEVQGNGLEVEGVQDDGIPGGGAARRYAVASADANLWARQTLVPLLSGIQRGDTVTVGFYARTVSANTNDGNGVIGVRFQDNAPPYGGFGDRRVSIGPEWDWYEVAGTATQAIDRANARVVMQLAGAKQVVEIGQTIVVKGASSIIGGAPAQAAAAQEPADEPLIPTPLEGAGSLLNRPDLRDWQNNVAAGRFEPREDPSIWLGQATRFTIDAPGENDWDLSANVPIEKDIAAGDKILVAIAAKTVSAGTPDGKALVAMRIQDNTEPYDGFAENIFKVGDNWQLIRISTTAPRDLPAGTAQLSLQFASEAQSVDIGPVYIFRTE